MKKHIKNLGTATALAGSLFAAGCGSTPQNTGVSGIELAHPYPYGEIPYGKNLVISQYDMDFRKNLVDLGTERVGAVITARMQIEYRNSPAGSNLDTETYRIEIPVKDEAEVRQIAENLRTYTGIVIRPTYNDGNGLTTDAVRVVPTQSGLVLRAPLSSLEFKTLEVYEVAPKDMVVKRGRIS